MAKDCSNTKITRDTKATLIMDWKVEMGSIIIKMDNSILVAGLIIKNKDLGYIFMQIITDTKGNLKTIWNMVKEKYINKMVVGLLDIFLKIIKLTKEFIMMLFRIKLSKFYFKKDNKFHAL